MGTSFSCTEAYRITPTLTLTKQALRVLRQQRHQGEEVVADRDLFRDYRHWKKNWKEVYGRADRLYVLAREDGTVGLGIYKQKPM